MNEILKLTNKGHWGHCPDEEEKWPATVQDIRTPESEEELKKTTNVMVVQVQGPPTVENLADINCHRSLGKLLRVTAWLLRFIKNERSNQDQTVKRKGRLNREELVQAKCKGLKATQAELRSQGNFQHLMSESGLLENNRIRRCVGRLVNSEKEQEVDTHRPIILPRDHAYMTLVIWSCHGKVLHSHVRVTLAEMVLRY